MSDSRDKQKLVVIDKTGNARAFYDSSADFYTDERGCLRITESGEKDSPPETVAVYADGAWESVGFRSTNEIKEPPKPPKSIQEQVRLFFELTYAAPSGEPGLFGAFVSGWDARKIYEDQVARDNYDKMDILDFINGHDLTTDPPTPFHDSITSMKNRLSRECRHFASHYGQKPKNAPELYGAYTAGLTSFNHHLIATESFKVTLGTDPSITPDLFGAFLLGWKFAIDNYAVVAEATNPDTPYYTGGAHTYSGVSK